MAILLVYASYLMGKVIFFMIAILFAEEGT